MKENKNVTKQHSRENLSPEANQHYERRILCKPINFSQRDT